MPKGPNAYNLKKSDYSHLATMPAPLSLSEESEEWDEVESEPEVEPEPRRSSAGGAHLKNSWHGMEDGRNVTAAA